MKIGLSLAGGGVKGAAHVGALKAFEEEKIKFDVVSGTSSGSIVSSLYASGYNADEIFDLFKKYSKKIKYVDLKNILKLLLGIIVKQKILINGFNSGTVIEKTIKKACNEKSIYNIKDCKVPILIPSVDLKNGAIYVFSSQQKRAVFSNEYIYIDNIEIEKAVRASCSFPRYFFSM